MTDWRCINLGKFERMVKRQFTIDCKNVYTVNDGIIERVEITEPLGHYADSGDNVGYLDDSKRWALMIRGNHIMRISYDAFMRLRKEGVVSGSQYPGVIDIEYSPSEFPDSSLGINTQYKLADRSGGDFDNVELGDPMSSHSEPVKTNIDPHVPDLIQDLGVQILGRQITEAEILIYKLIVEAVDDNAGESYIAKFNGKMNIVDQLRDEKTIMYDHTGSYITFGVPDNRRLHFMRRAIELYDGASIVSGGKGPAPISVAASAMNLSQEERERIGLVNQGTVAYQSNRQSVGQGRFGLSSSPVSVGSLHRPRPLSSSSIFRFEAPCVVRNTAPYYTMMSVRRPFVEFAKPIGSFLSTKITIDKRIPMRVVPMAMGDMYGYAFPKKMESDEKIVTSRCIPIATRVPGVYWIFYEMKRYEESDNSEIKYISRALVEYIDANASKFDLSKSSVVAGMASDLKTTINDAPLDRSAKDDTIEVYRKFFEETGKGLFRPMKVSYTSGFVIALTRNATQVLLSSVVINGNIDYSMYPEHITVIPVGGEYGLIVVGAEPADISEIEKVLSGSEQIADDDEFDSPDED